MGDDWAALADAVRRRRARLGLRQSDLEARGGPSAGTVKNIEQAARTTYAPRTFIQLETALRWPSGAAADALGGARSPEALCGLPELVGPMDLLIEQLDAGHPVVADADGPVTFTRFQVSDRPTLDEASETELTLELLTRLMRRAGDVGRRADAVKALSALLPLLHDEQGAG